jgi:hypothetical protein
VYEEGSHTPLELVVERLVVQEDIWVAVLLVESIFHLLDTWHDCINFSISDKNHEGGIGATRAVRGGRRRSGIRLAAANRWGGSSGILVFVTYDLERDIFVGDAVARNKRVTGNLRLELAEGGRMAVTFVREAEDEM